MVTLSLKRHLFRLSNNVIVITIHTLSPGPLSSDTAVSIEQLVTCLVRVLQRIQGRRGKGDLSQLLALTRLLLRLLTTILGSASTLFDLPSLSLSAKQTTQCLYELCSEAMSKDRDGNAILHLSLSTAVDPSSSSNDIPKRSMNSGSIAHACPSTSDPSSSSSSSRSTDVDADCFTSIGADHLLRLLDLIWSRLSDDLMRCTKHLLNAGQPPRCGEDDYDDDDVDRTSDDDVNAVISLLQSSAYSAAVLKMLSSVPIDCKRLLHVGTIAVLKKGFDLFYKDLQLREIVRKSEQIESLESFSNSSSSLLLQEDSISQSLRSRRVINDSIKLIANNTTQSIVQCLGILRSFSLERAGRQQIERCEVVGPLCHIQDQYQSHPLVALSCARVVAKLSLSESFRSQINSNVHHLRCLVGIVIQQSKLCQQVRHPWNE